MTEYITRKAHEKDDDDYDYEYDEDGNIVYYAVRPNKTQIKKEISLLATLGEEIAVLPSSKIASLNLPEKLENAIREIAKMPHKSARKRQLKFIAQQFYKMESDVEPILEKVAKFKNQSSHAVREHHIVEKWRERLLTQGQDALTELLDEHPHADRQHLRQLIRNAIKEKETAKPPKSSRLLYRYLKDLFEIEGEWDEDDMKNVIELTREDEDEDFDDDDFDEDDEDDDF
ncbi:MAG: ribosome biogenesis factor YjgA [Methylococcaceae bacterium]